MSRRVLLLTKKWFKDFGHDTPIGILDLAPYLRKQGDHVDVYYMEDIDGVAPEKYDIVGLSVFGADYKDEVVLADTRKLLQRYPGSKIVIGGRWTHTVGQETKDELNSWGVDVFKGEGEQYFFPNIPVDYSTYPTWDEKDLNNLQSYDNILMTSRGCPFDCYFCHNIERKMKYFSPQRTVDIIEMLFRKGKDRVFFVDDIFTVDVGHMEGVLDECARRNIPIQGRNRFFSHVNVVREKTCEAMARFQPDMVQVGLESGDDEMLIRMSKGFTVEKAEASVKLLSEYVPVYGLFLSGYPGETAMTLKRTEDFAERINEYLTGIWVSLYQPVRGTVGYEEAKISGQWLRQGFMTNDTITYLDKNLTKRMLLDHKLRILDLNKTRGGGKLGMKRQLRRRISEMFTPASMH